jgi:membrane protease YdiL (CAAX protease family)
MTGPDLLCLTLIAFALLLDHFVVWRAFLRRLQVDPTRARLWLYPALVGELWALAVCVLSLWLYEKRPWAFLRLSTPQGWRLWISLALVSALAAALATTIVRLARLRRRKRVKMKSHAAALVPHTRRELAWWAAVSLSAGFSEELIFRGYLIWAFRPFLGLWGGAALSLVVFATAHGYQGAGGALAVGIVGAFLTLVVLIFGSLWPAVVMHLLIDLQQGFTAWLVLQRTPGTELVADPPMPSST